MKRLVGVWVVVFSVFGLIEAAPAEEIIVYQFSAAGVDAETAGIITSLMRAELAALNDGPVTLKPNVGELDATWARVARGQERVDLVIVGGIFKIGDSATLKVIAADQHDAKEYHVVLREIGEINTVAPRLARSIKARQPFDESVTVTSVTKAETEQYQRITGDFSWGPRLGALVPVGGSYGGAAVLYQILLNFRYEIAWLGFEFLTGAYFAGPNDDDIAAGEFPLDFAMMYYFSESNYSLFVGGSVGLHYISVSYPKDGGHDEVEFDWPGHEDETEEHDTWTMSLAGFGGYEMLRTHSFHFTARLGYRVAINTLDDRGAHGPYFGVEMTF